jgi:4'-phosphopantetheinyl transferase
MKDGHAQSLDATATGFREAVVWAELPTPGIFVAAVIDDGAIGEETLMACLDGRERDRAQSIHDPSEKRHYVFRRSFQRLFVSQILNWDGAISELAIEHHLDTAPRCLDTPDLRLSFSSSGPTALACASRQHRVGIDIEKLRSIENVTALAYRFFTPEEAAAIAGLPVAAQSTAFLEHWTAKEAGLKAIGKGIVSGLNSFVIMQQGANHNIYFADQFEANTRWNLEYVTLLPNHLVAVVHSPMAIAQDLEKKESTVLEST